MDRVQIYIDANNLYMGAKENCGNGKVQINRFARFLADGRPLVKVKYFCVEPPEPNRSRFNIETQKGRQEYRKAAISYTKQLSWLQQLKQWKKIELIYGRLQRTKDGKLKEKGVDVALALHLVVDAAKHDFETAIVVSGDADLVMPIETAISWGKKVEGAAFQPCYHVAQVCSAFKFTTLTPQIVAPFLVQNRDYTRD